MRLSLIVALVFVVSGLLAPPARAEEPILVGPGRREGWKAVPADGVVMSLGEADGAGGKALRVDFDFQGRAGWAAARKSYTRDLPENWALSFLVRGDGPRNDLEVKLVDATGENVWWKVYKDLPLSKEWRPIKIRKRQVSFAWGPAGGGELRHLGALELAVTAREGGKGTVFVSDLRLERLPPERPYEGTPVASASSFTQGHEPKLALDGKPDTSWHSDSLRVGPEWLTLDFGRARELGGLVVDWEGADLATRYDVETSDDGRRFMSVRAVAGARDTRGYIALPETECRYLRFRLLESAAGHGFGVREISVKPPEWAETPNAFLSAVAADAPRGEYPRYLSREQSYWTLVGLSGGRENGLISEDGVLEAGKAQFSIEPFLYAGGKLVSWADVTSEASLADGDLPIPSVVWRTAGASLEITALADGPPGHPVLWARYRVHGAGGGPVKLFLAIRPLQVNPPWQFLGKPGGVSPIGTLSFEDGAAHVNGERWAVPVTQPSGFGAVSFDGGGVVAHLRGGGLPKSARVEDPTGLASGAFAFDLSLQGGEPKDVVLAVPLGPAERILDELRRARISARTATALFEEHLAAARRAWRERLDRVAFDLPPEAQELARTLRTALADVLVSRDGPAIRPGTRSYARSWIRDGALTSAALLRLGHADEVRDFIRWFVPYQYPDGKVPCCVDARGADPVPENDSHGELLYLVAEYYRFTGDDKLLSEVWPHVEKAVAYIETLRQRRRTPEYRSGEKKVFFGLLPESISHEGYSARPVHSYWDDFFALRGLADAVELARARGDETLAARWATYRDELRRDVNASVRETIARHRIDFVPGSAELGDFDATSTTAALDPAGEDARLPKRELLRTFERYWEGFESRRSDKAAWGSYTPYELRNVGAFVRLGFRARAQELLRWFLKDRRPAGWNQWAEVVWKDPRAPKFIGDMPHGWVASDFIRSFLDLFAYERREAGELVVGAGIPGAWLRSGDPVAVRSLRTSWGSLDASFRRRDGELEVKLGGSLRLPPGGLVIEAPLDGVPKEASLNGRPLPLKEGAQLRVGELPAELRIRVGRGPADDQRGEPR